MSLTLLTGQPGSGKSHQAVKYLIVPNYMQGRRILTNIKGLKEDVLIEYCTKLHEKENAIKEKTGLEVAPLNLGKIVPIFDKNITHPDFFPVLGEELVDGAIKETIDDSKSFVKSGDVVIVDEAGQWFDSYKKTYLTFLTMHRHFTDENNKTMEICFLVQDHTFINRKYLKLVKYTYVCKKLDMLGKRGGNYYNLNIYPKTEIYEDSIIRSSKQAYDPEIFPIYESYAGGTGEEVALDKRINILMSWKTWVFLIALCYVPYAIYKITHKDPPKSVAVTTAPPAVVSSSGSVSPVSQSGSASLSSPPSSLPQYRIVGVIDTPGKRLIFLQDDNNQVKVVYPQLCTGSGMLMTCQVENKTVSYYNPIIKKDANEKYLGGYNNENKNRSNNPAAVIN
jgi:zona occludens toxin